MYMHELMRQAGEALNQRNSEELENLMRQLDGLMMDESELRNYRCALNAMLEACYDLED